MGYETKNTFLLYNNHKYNQLIGMNLKSPYHCIQFGFNSEYSLEPLDISHIKTHFNSLSVKLFDSVTTTLDHIDRNVKQTQLILAEHQSHGRGRGDKVWQAYYGRQILMSYGPMPFTADINEFSAIVYEGLLSELLNYNSLCQFKEPNDIYIEGKKICGVLLERVHDKNFIHLGLNILPPDTPSFGSLFESGDKCRPQIREEILVQILRRIAHLDVEDLPRAQGFLRAHDYKKSGC